MWADASSKFKRYQYHSARMLHLKWFESLGTFRKASRSTILRIYELTIDLFSLKTGRVVRRDNNTGALVITTTLITIPALPILKCNDSSRFFLFLFFFFIVNTLFLRIGMENWKWNGKLKFSTQFPHSSFSTPRIFHVPQIFVICWIESVDPVNDLCLTNQFYSLLLWMLLNSKKSLKCTMLTLKCF